jgi:signal transduction histidine kinase
LHDEIGASLSHLAIQTHLAGQKLPEGSEHRGRLASISQSARETFDSMRDIVWMLQPAGGTWEEFAHRMESIAGRMLQSLSHEVSQEGDPPQGSPPMDWSRSVVAILKELANNAIRHSQASSVKVRMLWGEREFTLHIGDDGCGFDVEGQEGRGGSGLRNLQHRAEELGGKLEVASKPGGGTDVELRVPLPKGA